MPWVRAHPQPPASAPGPWVQGELLASTPGSGQSWAGKLGELETQQPQGRQGGGSRMSGWGWTWDAPSVLT